METTYVVYSVEQLMRSFDEQLVALASAGVDKDVIGKLRSWRDVVVNEAKDTAFQEGNLPFAPQLSSAGLCYVFDVAPHPAGLLPGASRGSGRLLAGSQTVAACETAHEIDRSAVKELGAVVATTPRFTWHQRQAAAAYGCDRDEVRTGVIVDLYA